MSRYLPTLVAMVCALGVSYGGAFAAEQDQEQRTTNLTLVGVDDSQRVDRRQAFELTPVYPDPIEGFNRGSLGFTKGVVDWVIHPAARGWRAVTAQPVRTGVQNFAYNWSFPVRVVSLLMQAEVVDAGEELGHTVVNTTAGVLGIFDVAKPLGIPTHRSDVGIAFARWGSGPGFYFVIPLLGPSTGRDAVGRVFDTALSPLTYVPGVGWLFSVNALAQNLDKYDALNQSGLDFYTLVRGLWCTQRKIDVTRYTIPESAYASSDPEPSLGYLRLRVKDRAFPGLVSETSAVSARTNKAVPFSLWLQPRSAPIVYMIPGIGGQRREDSPVALAELAYAKGYSVAIVSNPFNPEFIATGLSSLYPGYTPEDAADVYAAFTALDAKLRAENPGKLQGSRLMGYSLGGIEALFIAELERATPSASLHFERIVALNPAVDLLHAARGFDGYYNAPLRWPEAERKARVAELATKTFIVARGNAAPGRPVPIDRTESEFLIGLSGHATIIEALRAVEERGGGQLDVAAAKVQQQGAPLAELNAGSLENYAQELAVPYFTKKTGLERADLLARANLMSQGDALRSDERIRVTTNVDDFILGAESLAWLQETLGSRLTVFPGGGHLGNLFLPEVQGVVAERLEVPKRAASQ